MDAPRRETLEHNAPSFLLSSSYLDHTVQANTVHTSRPKGRFVQLEMRSWQVGYFWDHKLTTALTLLHTVLLVFLDGFSAAEDPI